MPKLKPGVKKKTSSESSLAYIERQKLLIGDDKYKAKEAKRKREAWARMRHEESPAEAEARKRAQNLRKAASRQRAKEKRRALEVPVVDECMGASQDTVQLTSEQTPEPSVQPTVQPLSVNLFRRGKRVTRGKPTEPPPAVGETPEPPRVVDETPEPPRVVDETPEPPRVTDKTPEPRRALPIDETPRLPSQLPAPVRRLLPSSSSETPADVSSERQSRSREVRTHRVTIEETPLPSHGLAYASGNMRINLEQVNEMDCGKPRVRDPVRDRLYHEKRKLKEKLAKEREAFGAEQRASARQRKRTEDAMSLIRQGITRIKSKRDRKKALHAYASVKQIKASRVGAEFARLFDMKSRAILYANKGRKAQKYTKSENTWHLMVWLQDPEHSITCAGVREKVVCRYKVDGRTVKVDKQKVILTEKLKTLYNVYVATFPERKCKRTFFYNVRRNSQFIKTIDQARTQVCLCMKHQNFAMKMRGLGKYCKLPQNADTLVRKFTIDEFETEVKKLLQHLPPLIMYEEWRMIPVPYLDPKVKKCVKKLRPVPAEMPRDNFVTMLVDQYPGTREHVQLAMTQHRTLRNLRTNLKPGEATIQMDFAQNWLIGYGEEVQAGFFAKDPITVHPVVIHVRVGDEIKTKCLIVATDDRKHDPGAILAILDQIMVYMKLHYPFVDCIHYWSDSPSSQYRNISMFSIICRHVERYGIMCTWSYFESGHGKGPCDGAGAAAKRKALLALKSGKNIVCARDFVENGNAAGGEMYYILVRVVDCYACRDLLDYLVTPRKVSGTMTIHNVMVLKAGSEIAHRRVSCYEDCCWDSKELCPVIPQRRCKTHPEWGKWTKVELYNDRIRAKLEKKQIAIEAKRAEEANLEARALATNAAVETYEKGQFVAAIWQRDWWVAVVRQVMILDEYHLQFMHPVSFLENDASPIYLDWPQQEDLATLHVTEILCPIAKPQKTTYEGTKCYTLPQNEVESIDYLFQNFKF